MVQADANFQPFKFRNCAIGLDHTQKAREPGRISLRVLDVSYDPQYAQRRDISYLGDNLIPIEISPISTPLIREGPSDQNCIAKNLGDLSRVNINALPYDPTNCVKENCEIFSKNIHNLIELPKPSGYSKKKSVLPNFNKCKDGK